MFKRESIRFAFQQTIPVMPGLTFLGMAYGLMMHNAGFHFIWAFLISVFVYAGSLQFLLVPLLSGGTGLLYIAMMTLFVNGRHIFYGLTLVGKYRQMGKRYPYMVFSLTDETYSILSRTTIPKEVNEKDVMFLTSLLNQCYWVIGSLIGGLAGKIFTFEATGIDFSMTALFIAIVLEQWREIGNRLPIFVGAFFSVILLIVLGPERFLLPSLTLTVLILLSIRSTIEKPDKM